MVGSEMLFGLGSVGAGMYRCRSNSSRRISGGWLLAGALGLPVEDCARPSSGPSLLGRSYVGLWRCCASSVASSSDIPSISQYFFCPQSYERNIP